MKTQKTTKIDAYFCQSFGPQKDNPGISNIFLSDCIVSTYNKSPKPLIIQEDAALAFPPNISIDFVISKHHVPGEYLDSYEVSRQGVEYCKQHGYETLLVFAHPDHIWRVMKTLKKLGIHAIAADTRGTPYDPLSVQIWTRSKWIFLPREILTRMFYYLTGKI